MKKDNINAKPILQSILPQDDAFHASKKFFTSEWWYFEAIFNNGYSAVIGFTKSSKKNFLSYPAIEIYKDGKLQVRAIERYLFQNFQISKNFPFVKLLDDNVIEFDHGRFNDLGEWVYNIALKIDNQEVNLKFKGTTPGWKIESEEVGLWTVALPKATVTGNIVVNGKSMNVNGIGYHDHNWINRNLSTVMNLQCWYWGKIMSETLTLTWANIVKKTSKGEFLAVLNQDNKGFFNIKPENIYFKPDNYIRNHGRKMPTSYTLKINDVVNDIPIHVDVDMEVKNIHRRFKRLLIAPYWRYLVETKGFLNIGSYKENVNKNQIMELFHLI